MELRLMAHSGPFPVLQRCSVCVVMMMIEECVCVCDVA
jgi:hypothetical protein